MSKLAKILLAVAGIAAALFLIVVIAVVFLVEPNDYRPYIVEAVEESTGRAFELQGDLGLEFVPCCSVTVGQASLASPEGFPEPQFASLESAALSLKLWPLLARREVEIDTVTLTGLNVTLVRTADGRDNWTMAPAEAPAAEPADGETAPVALSVEGMALRDGRIRYRDLGTGADYTLAALTADAGLAMADDRVTVAEPSVSLNATGTDLPGEIEVNASAEALVAMLSDEAGISVDQLTLDMAALGSELRISGGGRAGAETDLQGEIALEETSLRRLLEALEVDYRPASEEALRNLSAEAAWTLSSSSFAVQGLTLRLDDSVLEGSAAVTDFDTLATRFDLALDAIDVDAYLPAADTTAAADAPAESSEPTRIPLDALAGVPVNGELRIGSLNAGGAEITSLALALTSEDGRVDAQLNAAVRDGRLAMQGGGNVSAATPQLTGSLEVDGMNPRTLLSAMDAGVETADPNVLQRFEGRARWTLTPAALALEDIHWQLDDTTLTGRAAVEDLDRGALSFDLTLDRLNVDAYLPPDSDTAAEEDAETEIVPVEAIRGLTADGRLRAGFLTLLGMNLQSVDAQVSAADGVLRLDPLTASLYGGSYRGTVVVDATGPQARLDLEQQISAVQIEEILETFFDTQALGGALSLNLAGSGRGNTATELLRGLAADVSMDLSDGVYRGTDLVYQVRRARALFNDEPPPAEPDTGETPIRTLSAAGRMVDGVLQTRQLTAQTPALELSGQGGINLMELVLDYELSARVLEAAGGDLGPLSDARIPLSLEGPLTAPRVRVDMQGLVKSAVRETVQQKARDVLLDKLGGRKEQQPATEPSADGSAQATPDAEAAQEAAQEAEQEPEKPSGRDLLRRGLEELFKPKEEPQQNDG